MLYQIATLLRWPIERQIQRSFEAEGWRLVINDLLVNL